MALINRTDRYHMCYLISNDISEDKYYGLSHVTEHTLLIPSDIGLEFVAQGYTCGNHVYLYFSSEKLDTLLEINRKLMNGELFSTENVNAAIHQVDQEIERLRKKTLQDNQLISFVTENRIQRSAIGDSEQISRIQTEDVQKWFAERKHRNQISSFIFKDAHKMISSTPIQNLIVPHTAQLLENNGDDFLLFPFSLSEAKSMHIFFKLPLLYSKDDIIKKAVFEFCIQRILYDNLGFDVNIDEKFFNADERFIELSFKYQGDTRPENIVGEIRAEICKMTSRDFLKYRAEFKQHMLQVLKESESNFEVLNSIKNYMLYAVPRIQAEDLDIIDNIGFISFPRKWIINRSLKVVIK